MNINQKFAMLFLSFISILNVNAKDSNNSGISVFEIAPTQMNPSMMRQENIITNYKKYQVTEDDIKLLSQRPTYALKKYETVDGSSILELPVIEMRNFVRKGELPDGQFWIVYFTETHPNHFFIKGTNSLGQKINKDCGKLYDCFSLL